MEVEFQTVGGGYKFNRHGVDAEVAADQVAFDRVAEGDLRVAGHAVIEVGAEGGDFYLLAVFHSGDGAEFDAGVPDVVAPAIEDCADGFRPRGGSEIQVVAQAPQHGVAHGAAHEVQRFTCVFEGVC